MKLMVIGYARHGKDTVCEIIHRRYGLTFQSSSRACAELFIFNRLKDQFNYSTVDECYDDRHNHRQLWYDLIVEYNAQDATRLGRHIFQHWDMYCGIRNVVEFEALKKNRVFDWSVWVTRAGYPPEPTNSNTLRAELADFTIHNDSTLEQLEYAVVRTMNQIFTRSLG